METNPNNAVDFLIKNSGKFSKAKSERYYLDEFKKSKKALLMRDAELAGATTSAAQERDALCNPQYMELLMAIKIAMEEEELLKWQMIAAQLRVDIWRTEQANNRNLERNTL